VMMTMTMFNDRGKSGSEESGGRGESPWYTISRLRQIARSLDGYPG
jgi:hypothetical protein